MLMYSRPLGFDPLVHTGGRVQSSRLPGDVCLYHSLLAWGGFGHFQARLGGRGAFEVSGSEGGSWL